MMIAANGRAVKGETRPVLDLRPIFLVIGMLLGTLAVGMLLPAVADGLAGHGDWVVFATSSGVTLFIGGALILTNRTETFRFSVRQAFVLTTASWLVIAAFGALPFAFSDLNLSYTDAFFEAMSGLTTTGSTVLVGLDRAPPGILMWRALLQWLGGIGIIVMAIAVLPMLRVGGMQLFRMESSDQGEKAFPRATQMAAAIGAIYVALTALWTLMLWVAGMDGFEALAHAMTTIATGGFSTRDGSVGAFDNVAIDVIVTVGMVIGSLPFVLYLQTLRGQSWALWRDGQVRWFFGLAGALVGLMAIWHGLANDVPLGTALRHTAFNVVSIMTGTGYATTDYDIWGPFAVAVFFFIMFIGGCAGSTTCGVKIFRLQVLYEIAKVQLNHMLRPHGVFIAYYNRRPLPEKITESVLSFFFLFVFCFVVLAAGLGALGLDFLTSVSGAGTAIANVGPGLGPIIGPAGNFAPLPDAAKWLLSAGMLIGRLEVFTVLVLFFPAFWRE